MTKIFKGADFITLYVLLLIVYIFGLFIPLMENDSAQHASMAMRMYLENDFLNIYKGTQDYLDKPHMHFWLSAVSFKIFGVSHWAYRLPALLVTFLGAIACFKLTEVLYEKKIAHYASLIFLSTQAIFLANHDVRTDAVLTGFIICALWQLVVYFKYSKIKHLILGACFTGLAFSTKGLLGVFIIGVCLLSYLTYNSQLRLLFNWKILIGILAFVMSILPILYAYYVQFDLHPEKVIHGETGVSGIKFILWDQSFNRLTSKGFEPTSSDYFFFFHTILWAFLPWSIFFYTALVVRIKHFFQTRFKLKENKEALTSIGVLMTLIVMSFSKFKLPHYLNGLFPMASILIAGYFGYLIRTGKEKSIKVLIYIQYSILTLGTALIIFMAFWAFSSPHILIILGLLILFVGLTYIATAALPRIRKLVVLSVYFMVIINFCLNSQFYPNLLKYQAGNNIANIIKVENINVNDVYLFNGKHNSWSLDFYTNRITPKMAVNDLKTAKKDIWLFVYEDNLNTLKNSQIQWDKSYEVSHYRITKLKLDFINPHTRDLAIKKAYLLQIN